MAKYEWSIFSLQLVNCSPKIEDGLFVEISEDLQDG